MHRVEDGKSIIASSYRGGEYFTDPRRHSEDSQFKANNFLRLFLQFARQTDLTITSYVDVGCGSGDIVKIVADSLRESGFNLVTVKAYDVSPHVKNISNEGVEYVHGDFCESDEFADLVTLFDVFEHIPDPIGFLRLVSERCGVMGLHIPLDNSLNLAMRNQFRSKLQSPGHLIFMDAVFALNILAMAGFRVVEYKYTFGFRAPSGRRTALQKFTLPVRYLLAQVSPWLVSKTLGGVSLMVLAITPRGIEDAHVSSPV